MTFRLSLSRTMQCIWLCFFVPSNLTHYLYFLCSHNSNWWNRLGQLSCRMSHSLHILGCFLKVPLWFTNTSLLGKVLGIRASHHWLFRPRYPNACTFRVAANSEGPASIALLSPPKCSWVEQGACWLGDSSRWPTALYYHPTAIFATTNGWEPETTGWKQQRWRYHH